MRLGIFLLALAGCCSFVSATHNCLVGNLLVSENVITSKSVELKECEGLCRKQTVTSPSGGVVLLTCEENKLSTFINQEQECSSSGLETSCFCKGDECNKVDLKENIPETISVPAAPNNILCYVGFFANNTSPAFGTGDTVTCSPGNVCTSVSGVYNGFDAGVYACMPQGLCDSIFPQAQPLSTQCTNLQGTNVQGCCCYKQDCRELAPIANPPTPTPWNKNNQTCYQGISLNGVTLYGGAFSQCSGECGSARIRTQLNGNNVWAEVYVCDPVNVFTGLNLDNECKNLDTTQINGVPTALITGCACNSKDKCIDPTVVPPVYPIKQLKCATGLYNGSTWLGAEMNCQGRCGRLKFNANGQQVSYFSCMPYDVCAGFGLASTEDQTYNPPQDDELEVFCCSGFNNCNVNNPDILGRVNSSVVSTAKYPVLCYGGIWVNGVPITNSAYGLCQGECASASFTTTFANQIHNATIYTCDPVTMCQQAGISNSCGSVLGGVNACCCDNDLCIDPSRGGQRPQLRCYSGVSIPQDGYNTGGDQFCDGWCASLNSVVNGKNATVYYCAPVGMCRYFGLGFGGDYGNCAQIPGADPQVTGCCCSDSDNCLAPAGVNVTAIPARRDPRIVCYEGIHLNGQNISQPYYRMCDGECVSVSLGATVNNTSHYATLYTCDPSSACASMGLRNNCSTIDNSLTACCCDSNECIDPTYNRVPGKQLKCYVGLNTRNGGFNAGAEVICDGYCASASAVVGSDLVTAFHCAPRSMCRSLGLDNSNNTLYLDRFVNVGCCDVFDNCNLVGSGVNVTNIPPVSGNEMPRACYSAIFVGTNQISDGGWTACKGDCVAINLNTTVNGSVTTASLYTCDPSLLCKALNSTNRCHQQEQGLETCCCDSDACLDPTVNPPRKPYGDGNLCYVGAYSYDMSGNTIFNAGGEQYCQGNCAAVSSNLGNANVTVYACVPTYVCNSLQVYDTCNTVSFDRTITGCCCTNGPNCNLNMVIPRPPPITGPGRRRPRFEYPITCPAGLIVDGTYVTPMEFTVCDGECASISINTTISGQQHTASFYTCDPSSVCYQLGVHNNCASPESGVTACCCDSDACLDPNRGKTVPTPPLKCYVGLYSTSVPSLQTGAEQLCDGKCASVNARVANDNVTLFACVPHTLCRSLELYDSCARMEPYYPEFRACCCDNSDNCNVAQTHLNGVINTTIPLTPLNDAPISCYSGLFINGTAYSSAGWQTCQGECVSVSITSMFNGKAGTAALYTCDPSRVCRNLKMNNKCQTLENGVTGCCCNTNACIDPTVYPARTPGNQLMCYAGIASNYQINGTAINVGAQIPCNGQCSSLNAVVNGYSVSTYHCVPNSICNSLELYDNCKPVWNDNQVNACCCNNVNNCNIQNTTITPPPPPTTVDFAIACYTGLYVNGQPATPITLGACQGQCASIALNTTIAGVSNTAVFYGCDPTTVCQALNMNNNCASPEPGVTGCCCNTDLCIDPTKNKTNPAGFRNCYAGIYAQGKGTGSEIRCTGKCASVAATVNGDPVAVFGCVPEQFCKTLELYDECNTITVDRNITGCCCNNYNNCNVDLAGYTGKINTTIPSRNQRDYPITCYSGLFVNNAPISTAGWQACQGECASATISTMYNQVLTNATIYTCDPVSTCWQMGLNNNCTTIENGLSGCCCATDACLDPTVSPPRTPANPLKCYVGLQSTYNSLSLGAESYCPAGQCASLNGIVGGYNVTTYHCVADSICKSLELKDRCTTLWNDRSLTACCCNNADNCNLKDPSIVPGPAVLPDYPTACYQGLFVDGQKYSAVTLQECFGDCASISITTAYAGANHTASLYTCDPTSVCKQLNVSNSCNTIEPGVTGCCCDSDLCLDPIKGKTNPSRPKCYAGIYAQGKAKGSEIRCNGKCASISANVNGDPVSIFGCVPEQFCRTLSLYDQCQTITADRNITGCCCDNYDNCNVDLAGYTGKINTSMPVMNQRDYPIACYSGLFLNNAPISTAGWQACKGECASATISTMYNQVLTNATIYTCDPVSTCWQMGLNNNCTTIENGLSGCCCATDACLDPTVSPPRTPANPLKCYVGLQSTYNSLSLGAESYCPAGQCASLNGIVGGYNVTTYHCVADSICKSLELKDKCTTLWNDRSLTACCCNNADNCNLKDPSIVPGPPVLPDFPTACYQGLVVDNQTYSAISLQGCYGDCASVSITTAYGGANHTATLYTCDPTTVCQQLNVSNSCNTIEPGVSGCCCDSDGCLNPYTGATPGPMNCYVGIYTGDGKFNVGATMQCNGYCGSLETTVNGTLYKSYHCVPKQICKTLALNNERKTISTDKDVTGFCCTTGNNCHVTEKGINITNTAPAPTGDPISCRSSVYLNGAAVTDLAYTPCYGQCASVSYTGPYNGGNQTLTLYTCDPTAVCTALNLNNACASIDAGLSGCCCTTDNCVGPKVQPTPPGGSGSSISFSILALFAAVYIALTRH
ncbi:hypothetical protein L5515_008378 [Caenorhabditis briggsae]|uniref:Uncharacterized protein n=1 Tax=Caenorhabditis briggsae TaxID=6238 RepID=A0AAE9F7E1_CAEBR|nr:hypothetical protein L5515_008378 [Caenorhabditis briggsae]